MWTIWEPKEHFFNHKWFCPVNDQLRFIVLQFSPSPSFHRYCPSPPLNSPFIDKSSRQSTFLCFRLSISVLFWSENPVLIIFWRSVLFRILQQQYCKRNWNKHLLFKYSKDHQFLNNLFKEILMFFPTRFSTKS